MSLVTVGLADCVNSLEVCRDDGGEGLPAGAALMVGSVGRGGNGMAGGGEGNDAIDADFRRLEVMEFDRPARSTGDCGRMDFLESLSTSDTEFL